MTSGVESLKPYQTNKKKIKKIVNGVNVTLSVTTHWPLFIDAYINLIT